MTLLRRPLAVAAPCFAPGSPPPPSTPADPVLILADISVPFRNLLAVPEDILGGRVAYRAPRP